MSHMSHKCLISENRFTDKSACLICLKYVSFLASQDVVATKGRTLHNNCHWSSHQIQDRVVNININLGCADGDEKSIPCLLVVALQ